MPWAAARPTLWTSLISIRRPANFWPPFVMPNSAPCLIELMVSPPALARPMILPLEQERREILGVERHAHLAQHLAAIGLDDRGGVALQRIAERVVGGQEE